MSETVTAVQPDKAAMEKINEEKAAYLYDFLDNSSFYKSPVAKADRAF